MIPDLSSVLNGIVRTLVADVAPELRGPYAGMTVQLMATLLMMGAQEADRAAGRLIEENGALLELFATARRDVADADLRGAIDAAAAAPPAALTVTALRERNAVLRGLLVRLHAHVEEQAGPAARALEERLWRELVASTERRHLDLALS